MELAEELEQRANHVALLWGTCALGSESIDTRISGVCSDSRKASPCDSGLPKFYDRKLIRGQITLQIFVIMLHTCTSDMK
jgi:hypothetical protein